VVEPPHWLEQLEHALRIAALEQHWRGAVTAIVVPMLEGAAVQTALVAEQLAAELQQA